MCAVALRLLSSMHVYTASWIGAEEVRFYLCNFSAQCATVWNSLRHLGRLTDVARAAVSIALVTRD